MKSPFTFPHQTQFARQWHLYLYRLCLPVLVVTSVLRMGSADTWAEVIGGALTVLLTSLLWSFTWWGGLRLRQLDICVSLLLWVSFANALFAVGFLDSVTGIDLLGKFSYWAPLIALYWGAVYHDRRKIGVGQVILLYAALVLIDPKIQTLAGQSLFMQGAIEALAQGLLAIVFVAMFATVSAQMVENAVLLSRAEHRANHDGLTGLMNRRTFTQQFPRVARRSDRKNQNLILMLIDLDHFKSVNDRYGHAAGDQVLVQVSAVLKAGLRSGDLLYRWGGDEFAILMRETNVGTAAQIAERLRQAIERIRFDFACQVAISIGVASRRPGERSQDLFRRADEAMLCGKQAGRNQVGVASFDSSPITIFDTAPKDRRHTDSSV